MLDIHLDEKNQVQLKGRFDASQVDKARDVFDQLGSTTDINFEQLDYISSAGLGVLLRTQKRLNSSGQELLLKNMNKHIREIFNYAGFDMIFKIED
jgi:anti-sigma B factor antagonist